MKISKTKQKQIRRLAQAGQTARQIAKVVQLSQKEVEAAIAELAERTGEPLRAARGHDQLWRQALVILAMVLIGIAPLIHHRRLYNIANLPQMIYVQSIALVLMLAWLSKVVALRGQRLRGSPLLLPLALFLGWGLCSIFWAINRYEHLYTWSSWMASGLIFFLALQIFDSRRFVRLLVCLLHGMGFVVALIGIAQHLVGLDIYQQVSPPAASFANKNFAVHVVVPALALGIGLFFWLGHRGPEADADADDRAQPGLPFFWIPAVTCTFMAAYLFYTGTRAGWLAAGAMLLLWLLMLVIMAVRKTGRILHNGRILAIAACLPLLLVMMHMTPQGFDSTVIRNQIERINTEISRMVGQAPTPAAPVEPETPETPDPPPEIPDVLPEDSPLTMTAPTAVARQSGKRAVRPRVSAEQSFAGRLKVWRNTLYLIGDRPILGTGVGNFKIYFPIYDGMNDSEPMFSDKIQLSNTHNDFLQVWADTGTVGILLCLWGVVMLLIIGVRLWKSEQRDIMLILGIFIALCGMGVNAFFSSPMQKAIPPMMLALLLASLSIWHGEHRPKRQQERRGVSFNQAAAIASIGVLVIAMVVVGRLQTRRLQCDADYVYMSAAARQKLWNEVFRYGNMAHEHLPARRKTNAFLGKAFVEISATEPDAARRKQMLDTAIGYFFETLEAYPNSPNTLFDIAVAYAKLEQWDTAIEYYMRLNELMPNYPRLHNNIAAAYMAKSKNPELTPEQKQELEHFALAEFRLETVLSPDNPRVWFNYAVALRSLGYHEPSAAAFRASLELDPRHALGWKELGVLYFQFMRQQEEGLNYLEKALEIDPNVPEAEKIRQILRVHNRL